MNASMVSDSNVNFFPPLAQARKIDLKWNPGLVAGSIAISLLGAFTTTQLICQARTSSHFSDALVWTALASVTFGCCAIWGLHEVAMLACKIDLPVRLNPISTATGLFLAISFTFLALASDTLWPVFLKWQQQWKQSSGNRGWWNTELRVTEEEDTMDALLGQEDEEHADTDYPHHFGDQISGNGFTEIDTSVRGRNVEAGSTWSIQSHTRVLEGVQTRPSGPPRRHSTWNDSTTTSNAYRELTSEVDVELGIDDGSSRPFSSSNRSPSRGSSSGRRSSSSLFGSYSKMMSFTPVNLTPSAVTGLFWRTGMVLYNGSTIRNIIKSFIWSLSITSMHYVEILGLQIPDGYFSFNPSLALLSELISWGVCLVGCTLMSEMETHLGQQILFTVAAATGVAGMHFTGMYAVNFWTYAAPTEENGYPPALAAFIGSIAITVCLMANAILAHTATVARNRLAEVVMTKKKLWMAIAQKQNAESAAAARSEFIASASHEIRTPLHHLQGYSDLLSRTELTEEGKVLLMAIQRATKTLSLITNNVLDWSRLERDAEAVSRPVALDIRVVCESLITMLPNEDEDVSVELMVVVAPNVPHSLLLDETYIHRVIMNLLSNALKFTYTGYVLLLVEMKDDRLVVTVKDTGVGVPTSFLPQLFEPFKQAQTRGQSRGTGLGLSIVKQLLHKMDGTIDVETVHAESNEARPEDCGSTFTITIPVKKAPNARQQPEPQLLNVCLDTDPTPEIAIFQGSNRQVSEALELAWQKYNFKPFVVQSYFEMESREHDNLKYIWADLETLRADPGLMKSILSQDKYPVLVPYDIHKELHGFPDSITGRHIIPIRRPLIFHSIHSAMEKAAQAGLYQRVRFADTNETGGSVSSADSKDTSEEPKVEQVEMSVSDISTPQNPGRGPVVLLVEDNPINRKLGSKMLTSLGYTPILANDGVECISLLLSLDSPSSTPSELDPPSPMSSSSSSPPSLPPNTNISLILMDQSMPRKDGITTTREIRELEKAGLLKARRPIIAVTAVVSPESRRLCQEAGTDDFLAKPLSMRVLRECLERYIGRQGV
ncbi:PAS/PAC sensor hybrid histidine kinase [Xylogone sp. PMI_703]|nr:PAS/PAC sensor hybrid histidine kinase [Xylogone sp. PMI_703]